MHTPDPMHARPSPGHETAGENAPPDGLPPWMLVPGPATREGLEALRRILSEADPSGRIARDLGERVRRDTAALLELLEWSPRLQWADGPTDGQ